MISIVISLEIDHRAQSGIKMLILDLANVNEKKRLQLSELRTLEWRYVRMLDLIGRGQVVS